MALLACCPYAFENELDSAYQCHGTAMLLQSPTSAVRWARLCRTVFPCKGVGVLLKVHRY